MMNTFDIIDTILSTLQFPYVQSTMGQLLKYHPGTYLHSLHVASISIQLADVYGMTPQSIFSISAGALTHDIGKVRVPIEILNKNGTLSPSEKEIIQMHPLYSFYIINSLGAPKTVSEICLLHHKYADLSGYPASLPDGFVYEKIPLGASIVTIADIFSAIVSPRSYKNNLSETYALSELYKMASRGLVEDELVKILELLIRENRLLINTRSADASSLRDPWSFTDIMHSSSNA